MLFNSILIELEAEWPCFSESLAFIVAVPVYANLECDNNLLIDECIDALRVTKLSCGIAKSVQLYILILDHINAFPDSRHFCHLVLLSAYILR